MQRQRLGVSPYGDCHRYTRVHANRLLDIFEPRDGLSVDAEDHIARSNSTLLGRAPRLHLSDLGGRIRLAEGHEQNGQDDDGEREIRRWPGGDDGGALTEPLVVKRNVALALGQPTQAGKGLA